MDKSAAGGDAASSPQPKRRFWRFFLWGIGLGGGFLLLALGFLVAITIPNLRREVAPPEISGVDRVERNAEKSSTPPTSSTLTVSFLTSGTLSPLNLDDFHHLSPKMRTLAQGWMDQCAETDRLIAAISDPVLRAQALSLLKDREARMRILLNLPLEWENQSSQEAFRRLIEQATSQNPYGSAYVELRNSYRGLGPDDHRWESFEFFQKYPELADSLGKEVTCFQPLADRMYFELSVRNQMWSRAAYCCFETDRIAHNYFYGQKPGNVWWCERAAEVTTREEGVYCMRQAGVTGLGWLTAYSYQRTIDSLMDDPNPSLLYHHSHRALRMSGNFMAEHLAETLDRE